eukprot:m.179043 g.179043  ORF g.179043 m.179043 type:complete len:477 (-) comp16843_c0_seq16:3373-4803(-)
MAPTILRVGLPDGNFKELSFIKPSGEPRLPTTPGEIIDQVVQLVGLKPSSRSYFGLYKRMSPNGSLDWLEPTKPITPEAITAATSFKLFFRLRFKPPAMIELAAKDKQAGTMIHQQVVSAIKHNELPPLSNPMLLEIGTLSMILFVIEDFYSQEPIRRCSQTPPHEVLPYVNTLCGFESFLAQKLLDDYDAVTLERTIQGILQKYWPVKDHVCLTNLLHLYDKANLFGSETFQLSMDSAPANVQVTPDLVTLVDVMSSGVRLEYRNLSEIIVSNSTEIIIRSLNGQEYSFQTDTYSKAEGFVSMINGYVLIAAGRSIAKFTNANCQFGAHFGVQDRKAAKTCLDKYAHIPGAYYLRQREQDTNTYGLTVVNSRGASDAYKILKHASSSSGYKYGIEDGLRYSTVDELMEHYHNEKDGLSHMLRINVFALEHGEQLAEPSIYASVEAASRMVDGDNYVLDAGGMPAPKQAQAPSRFE